MPLSNRKAARKRQLENLKPGPPAPKGNARAAKHFGNATSKTLPVGSVAEEIYTELAAEAPLRAPDGSLPAPDRTLVELLALCLSRLRMVAVFIDLYGALDEQTGEPRPAVDLERRLRVEARDHAAELGMGPRSRSRLGLDLVQVAGVAEVLTSRREALEGAHPCAGQPPSPTDSPREMGRPSDEKNLNPESEFTSD